MGLTRKVLVGVLGTAALAAVAGLLLAVLGVLPAGGHTEGGQPTSPEEGDGGVLTPARVVHPLQDATLTLSVQELTSVEPLFEADVRAQVAGIVHRVPKSIGDPVTRDESLVDVDVPDLDAEVRQKQAVIRQRERDVLVATAMVGSAAAQKTIAERTVTVRKAERDEAIETREFRYLRLQRYEEAVKEGGINKTLVAEERRNYNASSFGVEAAEANVLKAEADVQEKESALQVALADVELKKALTGVAREDYERARAQRAFANIVAPFDGVITERYVNPGALVQNASTGRSEALLTVARIDVVTLVMKVPDNFAPYVTRGTEAVVQIDQLPGVTIRGKVTRIAPTILNRDRTLRVEVDLYNGSEPRFRRLAARCTETWLAPLGAADPLQVVTLARASREAWSKDSRSLRDPFPMMPEVSGKAETEVRLLPGMSGYMRLNLREFRNVALIPANAVYTIGGTPYVLAVEDVGKDEKDVGVTRQLPVRVQVNDGKLAKVSVIVHPGDPLRGQPEKLRDLDPKETIVLSRQLEIGPGQRVKVNFEE